MNLSDLLRKLITSPLAVLAGCLALALPATARAALDVCCTTPELGSLAREVGGDRVHVTVFASGMEDPHYVEAKPSFVKSLSGADALVCVGMELEVGWLPVLTSRAGNSKVLPGSGGYIDASRVIKPLEVPSGQITRSMGDIHPAGNPHFLLDPINGLTVAGLLRDKFSTLDPQGADSFQRNYKAFRLKLGAGLVGGKLLAKYGDFEKLCTLNETGKLLPFLDKQGDRDKLSGWIGLLAPYAGSKVIDDHPMWPYFARRYGLTVAGHLEPKPGVPPTSGHLQEIIALVKAQGVKALIQAPYYDPKHAQFVTTNTGVPTVKLAHQAGAVSGTDDYISMCDYNARTLAAAFKGSK